MPITPAQLRTLATNLTRDGVLDKADVDQLVDATMQDGSLDAAEKAELKQILVDLSDRVDTAATHSRLAAFLDMPDDAIRSLAAECERRLWVFGGGRVVTDGILGGAIDTLDLTVVPEALGSGIPLFTAPVPGPLRLVDSIRYSGGAMRLLYDLRGASSPTVA